MHDRDDLTDNWKIAKRREIRGKILVFGEEKKKADEKKMVKSLSYVSMV